jgi:hypothetical protein
MAQKDFIKELIILASKKPKKRKKKLTQDIPQRIFQRTIMIEPIKMA